MREVPLYLPPGARGSGAERYPLILVLAGFTSRGQSYLETHPWRRGVVWHYDRAVARGDAPPAILCLPDCFTRLGGSQYVNSSATGRWEDHVVDELLPFAHEVAPVRSDALGVAGKSSGGFGALHLALRRPGLFRACASISGDLGFRELFSAEMLQAVRGLLPHGSDPRRFLESFWAEPDLSGDGHAVLNALAMAACYAPSPQSELGFELPVDLETGAPIEEVWRRFLAFDPLERVASEPEGLRELELLHVECGLRDEFHLQWGARRFAAELARLDIPHTHEEHPGSHRGIDARYQPVLARMAGVLAQPRGAS